MEPLARRTFLRLAGAGAAAAAVRTAWPLPATAGPAAVPALGATPAAEYDAVVADEWFDLLRSLVQRAPGYSPPVAARAIGYTAVSLYEAVVPGLPHHRSLAGLLNGLGPPPADGQALGYHWPSVANAALAAAVRSLMPAGNAALQESIDRLEQRFVAEFGPTTPRGVHTRSRQRGAAVAGAVADWARTDGGHEAYLRNFPTDYTPPAGPGLWVPTPPAFQRALQPWWGTNRGFLLPSPTDCTPAPPPVFSDASGSTFHAEAMEVHSTVASLTAEQMAVARFWADDPGATATPAGHSVSLLTQVLRATGASLATAAEAYALLGIAVNDAFVACWQAKFHHNLLRPITFLRAHVHPAWGDAGGPYPMPLTTPPFPEYPSGHSAQSAAAAEVLTALFGNRAFTDHTHDGRGLPSRSFASFSAAAEEAAMSRLYGGIHYRSGIEQGMAQGRCIGVQVRALPLRHG